MALAASLSLTNCAEKIEGPIAPATPAGIPFEISADISTKTTNNGLATQWAEGDAINLFHAEAGKTDYVSDNDFKLDATRVGVFKGSLTGTLDASKSYDWYAIYPYNKNVTTPANNATTAKYFYVGGRSDTPAVQNGNNSTSHLVERYAPLWGKAANVPSNEKPSMIMQHLASVVKVKVTNTTEKPLTVNSVAFTSTEPIVGQFYIDVTGAAVEYTTAKGLFNSSTASLTVNGATPLANGESAVYYIPIKPHTAASGSILKISVNGYEKPLTLPKDVTFTAGKIKTLAFNYVDYVTIPWAEDFSGDLSLYTRNRCTLYTSGKMYAGGIAPELLISDNGGAFSVKVKADAGNYLLTFKSNRDNLTVASSDKNVTVTKNNGKEYLLTVPEGGSTFSLSITNTDKKDNARIDDISLVADTAVRVPVITVDNTNVSVKAEGDIVTLKYSIKYPSAGATIAAVSKETWVNTFDCTKAGEITFAVDANGGEARTVTVTLSYPGAEDVAVTVSQSAKGAVVTDYSTVYTSNLKFNAGKKVKIGGKEYDAVQLGTSKKSGQITFNVPAGTKKLCLHVVGWNDEGGKTHTIATSVGKISSSSITTTADTGATGDNSTFTLSKTDYSGKEYYFEFTLTNVTEESTITIKNSAGKSRGVYFGINAE